MAAARRAKRGAKKSAKRSTSKTTWTLIIDRDGTGFAYQLIERDASGREVGEISSYRNESRTDFFKRVRMYEKRVPKYTTHYTSKAKAKRGAKKAPKAAKRGAKKTAKPAARKSTWTLTIDRVGYGLGFRMVERDAAGREVGEYKNYRGESRAAFLKRLRATAGLGKGEKFRTRRTSAAKAKTPAKTATKRTAAKRPAKRTARGGPSLTAAAKKRRQAAWNRFRQQHAGKGISLTKLAATFKREHPIRATR